MRLTKSDKNFLKERGYLNKDLEHIERAILKRNTKYEINNRKASLEEVLEVLDREEYLSGIARSAFHWSAVRHSEDNDVVYFDSSNLFRQD